MTAVTLPIELARLEVALRQKREAVDELEKCWSFHKRILMTTESWTAFTWASWHLSRVERRIAIIEQQAERLETEYYARLGWWAVEEAQAIII